MELNFRIKDNYAYIWADTGPSLGKHLGYLKVSSGSHQIN